MLLQCLLTVKRNEVMLLEESGYATVNNSVTWNTSTTCCLIFVVPRLYTDTLNHVYVHTWHESRKQNVYREKGTNGEGGGIREGMGFEREYTQSALCENILTILMLLYALKFATSSYPFTHTFINREGLIISISLPIFT